MVRRSRTPQGVRGLKRVPPQGVRSAKESHSARSAWIETRGEPFHVLRMEGRTPQGVRGLKLQVFVAVQAGDGSHSARSAWIETQ